MTRQDIIEQAGTPPTDCNVDRMVRGLKDDRLKAREYFQELLKVMDRDLRYCPPHWETTQASTAQKVEAFLKACGKWEDENDTPYDVDEILGGKIAIKFFNSFKKQNKDIN